ncbi:MAG: tetratricopeptide repeat protein [Selenomonadaceae bacterium]|nr:tetratricopeptide repeat protein [Selenomonadaceae bacterium]
MPELNIVNTQNLSTETIAKIDTQVDAFIAKHKENSVEINRIVFDGTAALVAGDNLAQNIGSQGKLKRFWRRFNGDNGRTQDTINANLIEAQYAAQKMIQKLAEQNLLTFELIAAVNNSLNAQIVEVNDKIIGIKSTLVNFATNVRDKQNSLNAQIQDVRDEQSNLNAQIQDVRDEQNNLNAQIQETNARIIEIKRALVTFFRNVRSDIINLSLRLEIVERNVKILNWQNSIEFQVYRGVEYQDLDDMTKIVLIVHDFFDITNGKWSTSDLLLLKKAMATIGLNPKSKISYEKFVKHIRANHRLYMILFGRYSGFGRYVGFATEYEAIAFSLNKMNRLETEENYIVHMVNNSLAKNGINISNEDIIFQLTDEFVAQKIDFHLSAEVSNYELILELLCNFVQWNYVKSLKKRGDTYYKQGKYEQAIQEYDKAIELNPNYINAYINRSFAYGELGEYRLSIIDNKKVTELLELDYYLCD